MFACSAAAVQQDLDGDRVDPGLGSDALLSHVGGNLVAVFVQHVETLPDGTGVKLGVFLSNTKTRRAKLTADRLATAAECGRLSEGQWERLIATAQSPRERELLTEFAKESLAARRLDRGGRGIGPAPHADATPPATPDEVAAAAAEVPDVDPDGQTTGLWWVGALHDDAEAMRQLAASPKLLVRRSVARAARLPRGRGCLARSR